MNLRHYKDLKRIGLYNVPRIVALLTVCANKGVCALTNGY